jgi:hypothetical protein
VLMPRPLRTGSSRQNSGYVSSSITNTNASTAYITGGIHGTVNRNLLRRRTNNPPCSHDPGNLVARFPRIVLASINRSTAELGAPGFSSCSSSDISDLVSKFISSSPSLDTEKSCRVKASRLYLALSRFLPSRPKRSFIDACSFFRGVSPLLTGAFSAPAEALGTTVSASTMYFQVRRKLVNTTAAVTNAGSAYGKLVRNAFPPKVSGYCVAGRASAPVSDGAHIDPMLQARPRYANACA